MQQEPPQNNNLSCRYTQFLRRAASSRQAILLKPQYRYKYSNIHSSGSLLYYQRKPFTLPAGAVSMVLVIFTFYVITMILEFLITAIQLLPTIMSENRHQ